MYANDCSVHQQVTLEQTSAWVNAKFSSLIKILAEKQEASEVFIEELKEATISEAEARLAELEGRSQILRESQGQIAAVQSLADTELIKVCRPTLTLTYFAITEKECAQSLFCVSVCFLNFLSDTCRNTPHLMCHCVHLNYFYFLSYYEIIFTMTCMCLYRNPCS